MNPTSRTERDGVPLFIYDEPDGVTVASGSYGMGHGLSVTLHPEFVGEVTRESIEDELDTLFEEAYERVLDEVERNK